MNATRPNALGLGLSQFFREYLPALRGLSPRTIEGKGSMNYRLVV